jgi:hypothetical protein
VLAGAIGQFPKEDATEIDDKECFDVIGVVNVIEHFEEHEKVLAILRLKSSRVVPC